MEGMKPVKVYSCVDRVQADMITETLNEQGIPAYSESKGSGDYMNIYMGVSMFGNDIYVNEKDQDKAKELISVMTSAVETADSEDAEMPVRSSDRKLRIMRSISLIAALLLIIGAVVPSIVDILFG